jgi:hypothetical protein
MSVSSYRKLRLSPSMVVADATARGLELASQRMERGLATVVLRSSPHPAAS